MHLSNNLNVGEEKKKEVFDHRNCLYHNKVLILLQEFNFFMIKHTLKIWKILQDYKLCLAIFQHFAGKG